MRKSPKLQFTTTEVISNDIADYIGPNWRDYRPVSEIVSEFVREFGLFRIDQVPERSWVPFINRMERQA